MLLTALLITIFIFAAGLYVGFLLDGYRVDNIDTSIRDVELDSESFLAEEQFFDAFGKYDCDLLNKRILSISDKIWKIGNVLTTYDLKGNTHDKIYEDLRREFFIFKIRAYTLTKDLDDSCGKSYDVILFFYDTKDNQDSINQGYVLDDIVKKNKEIAVFSIDKDFNDSAVSTLVDYYNVTIAPTVVVNYDNKFDGYNSAAKLAEAFED